MMWKQFPSQTLVLLVNYLCSLFNIQQHLLWILKRTSPTLILKDVFLVCLVCGSSCLWKHGCWVDHCLRTDASPACLTAVADAVRTSLGPKGMDKMVSKQILSSASLHLAPGNTRVSKADAVSLFVSDPGWERWRDHHQWRRHHPETDAGAPPCSQNGTFQQTLSGRSAF